MVANTNVTVYRSRVCVYYGRCIFCHKPFSVETQLQLVDVIHILTLSTVLLFYFGIVPTVLVTRLTRRVPLVEQERLTLPEHLS